LAFLIAAFVLVTVVSCNDDDEPSDAANVTFTFDAPVVASLSFGEPYAITGSVTSSSGAITNLVFTGVEESNGTYTAVGDEQSYPDVSGSQFNFNMDYFVDNNT